MNAVLIVDKPAGITSHDVVHRVRKILNQKSVGHLGTLDPMATGVLPIVVGGFTRLAQFYAHSGKTYEGEMQFGFSTDTYDGDGDPVGPTREVRFSAHDLKLAAEKFTGVISQKPPPFSAKKIHGVPAYKLARRNEPVDLKTVEVTVQELVIAGFAQNVAAFRATVSSGTYIRSIAHDLGQLLECGAHLKNLRRTRSGEFDVSDAVSLELLTQAVADGTEETYFIHPRKLLREFPSVTATEESASRIRHGNAANLAEFSEAKQIKIFDAEGQLISIATRIAGTLFQPKIVLI